MKKNIKHLTKNYATFLKEIKTRIQRAQVKANFAVNRELILLYWDIGRMACSIQKSVGWGKGVIPGVKNTNSNLPQPVTKLDKILELVTELPWGHNILLMEKIKSWPTVGVYGAEPSTGLAPNSLLCPVFSVPRERGSNKMSMVKKELNFEQ